MTTMKKKKLGDERAAVGCILAFVALGWACGGAPGDDSSAEAAGDGSEASARETALSEAGAAGDDAADTIEVADPGAGRPGVDPVDPDLGVEEPPPLRTYRVRLVNSAETPALVYASAGAEPVLLDTVPGGDSVRVDVEVRADRLQLEASEPSGEPLGAGELELHPDEVVRWEVPGAPPED